ncbi:CLI_3235 family bacteriocin precursor [Clostridium sporogenes]|uniref:CLI_3235 family bacteriocin precursor n=1 Tax=Clostridium sporogenes TaxID=1509 RepID=UPI0022378DC7|nr:CLI_3235 family bacteriocin precursor [Clostridium sporogenes]MCW6089672.1 CLI_3235 family bacteriocin precursor [Clostridium sporogenes]
MKKLTKKLNFKPDTVEAYCTCNSNCSCYQTCGAVGSFRANNADVARWDGKANSSNMSKWE